ncbi:MAG: hypothetical protein PHR77_03365 [Kiritimatiellae bacterium]|nr:hypothetical protein [Kiritimatiellia bacterium]MDD5519595.1 hypothetical protein [Kiritimatiellia bacterium]
MFKKSIFSCVIALIAMGLFSYSPAARASEPTLLVVPSHYTTVQLAFDIAKLRRNILIVSFSEAGVKTGQALYIWDSNTAAWVKITFADYNSGSIFSVKPERIIIIGSEKDVPPVLGEVSSWCSNVKRIPTLAILDTVNSLDKEFSFTSPEWKWLAKEYDLKLEDRNAERRRYGRYGKPGERTKAPMPVTPTPAEPKMEKPATPVMIQIETPETTTKKKSLPENK